MTHADRAECRSKALSFSSSEAELKAIENGESQLKTSIFPSQPLSDVDLKLAAPPGRTVSAWFGS